MNKNFIINETIDSDLSLQDWQSFHIQKGMIEAQNHEFASDEEVKTIFEKWKA